MQTETTTRPRIYVASLSDYNAGRLHGRWIDATQDSEDITEEIEEMLAESPEPVAEEWAIHDYEGFGSLRLGEFEDIERISAYAQAAEEHGPAFQAFVANLGSLEYMAEIAEFEDKFRGEWDSLADYAYWSLDEQGALERVPEWLRAHIDYESIARDWDAEGMWTAPAGPGRVFVFDA